MLPFAPIASLAVLIAMATNLGLARMSEACGVP